MEIIWIKKWIIAQEIATRVAYIVSLRESLEYFYCKFSRWRRSPSNKRVSSLPNKFLFPQSVVVALDWCGVVLLD